MYYVYILKLKTGRLYYGYSSDLKRRIKEHNSGGVKTTRLQSPELVYYEAYKYEKEARIRELEVKKGKGRKDIKRKLTVSLQ